MSDYSNTEINPVIEIRNTGGTLSSFFEFGGSSVNNWKVYGEIEGLGSLTPNLDTSNLSIGYGSVLRAQSLGSRYITFRAVYTGKDKNTERNRISWILRPVSDVYSLKIKYYNKSVELRDCCITNMHFYTTNRNDFLRLDITFMCLDPIMYGDDYDDYVEGSYTYTSEDNMKLVSIHEYDGTAPTLPYIYVDSIFDTSQTNAVISIGNNTITISQSIFDKVLEFDFSNISDFVTSSIVSGLSFSDSAVNIRLNPYSLLRVFNCSVHFNYRKGYFSI